MSLRLTLKAWTFPAGIEAEAPGLLPERVEGIAGAALAGMTVRVGRRDERVGDLFEIEDAPGGGPSAGDGLTPGGELTLVGDLRSFPRLGAGMSRGRLIVEGSVGACAGSGMSGGRLEIRGDAGTRAGEGMTGGVLVVRGSAGDDLGGAPPTGSRGLDRGVILVFGNAGARAGRRMRRGVIAIAGDAGPLLGTELLAGTIVVLGRAGAGVGTWMRRGTILLGSGPVPGPPAFAASTTGRFPFWSLYDGPLRSAGMPLPEEWRAGRFRRFVGDRSGAGFGEILVPVHERAAAGGA